MKTKTRFHKLTAWLLTVAMLITLTQGLSFTAFASEAEIKVNFDAGDYEWKTDEQICLLRRSTVADGDTVDEFYYFTASVAEDGTVTWTPDNPLYWDGEGEHTLIVNYPTTNSYDRFTVPSAQNSPDALRAADAMNARWVGTPTTNEVEFKLNHRMAKVMVNYEFAEGVTAEISKIEVYSNSAVIRFSDADGLPMKTFATAGLSVWVTPYLNGNQFTAFVSPDTYAADGNFIKITLDNGTVYEVKMNEAITFAEGGEYTYNVMINDHRAYFAGTDGCTGLTYTDNGDGTHDSVCTECGYAGVDNEKHTVTKWTHADDTTHAGNCACGAAVTENHFVNEATCTWSEDYSTCTAKGVCVHCNNESIETVNGVKDGNKITATFENSAVEPQVVYAVTTSDELNTLLQSGETVMICLGASLENVGNIRCLSGTTAVLDLNGYNITFLTGSALTIKDASLTLEGEGTITATGTIAIYAERSALQIEDDVTINGDRYAVFLYGAENETATVNISGGRINAQGNGENFYFENEHTSLTITGGTFSCDPSAYVDTEYCTVSDNEDGTWTVCEKDFETIIVNYDENTKSAMVTVKEAGTYSLIFAKYGEGNRLDKVDIVEYAFDKGENIVPQRLTDFTLGTGDKIMLWQDMINLVPMCEAYIVK